MKTHHLIGIAMIACVFCSTAADAPSVSRAEWGAPAVDVSHANGRWVIAGQKNKVKLDESNLALSVEAGPVTWAMAPSEDDDLVVKSKGDEFKLRLADAGKKEITTYDTGYKTGVKTRLDRFRRDNNDLDLALVFTVCLEGKAEELVCDVVALEREAVVRQLDWPKEVDTRGANSTALNHVRGNLLPCNWPKEYHPCLNVPSSQGQEALIKGDKSYIQSNLIECWSMSWWGAAACWRWIINTWCPGRT